MNFHRTIGNWRWWLVIPLVPLALMGQALLTAGEEIFSLFNKAYRWQRKGWKA